MNAANKKRPAEAGLSNYFQALADDFLIGEPDPR